MSTTSFNPVTTATNLATAYMQPAQTHVADQQTAAAATATALTTLQSALTAFDSAVTGLSAGTGVTAFTSTFSNSAVATATASSSATAGTYSFFVQQLATAQQTAYSNIAPITAAGAGTLTVNVANGSSFHVDLSAADTDGDGSVSPAEMARAINQATGNNGAAVASVVTVGSQTELVLSAGNTGSSNAITLDTSGLADAALKASLAGGQQLAAAQDAIVFLGGQGGIKMQQGSNTFNSIAGVSITFTQAQIATDPPVTLTVASNSSATAQNVQTFVTAYNAVQTALATLTADGSTTSGAATGAFANDPGILSLQSKLNQLIRQPFGGKSLVDIGVSADQYGTLSVDQKKLTAALAADPTALSNVFGSTGFTAKSGLLGGIDTYLQGWLNAGTGQIAHRRSSVQAIQKSLTAQQTSLTNQYNNLYQRYLSQFTALQTLQSQISQTQTLFAAATSSTSG